MIDYETLANTFIDEMCDTRGVRSTIECLLNYGLTKEDLLELDFDEIDIDYVIEENEEGETK